MKDDRHSLISILTLLACLSIALTAGVTKAAEAPGASTGAAEEAKATGADPNEGAVKKDDTLWMEIWKRVQFGTVWYLHYGFGESGGDPFNRARISRGYVTLKVKPVEWFRSRVTLDTHQDDTGDFKVRLKYMYGEFVAPIETAVVTEPAVEFGLVHGPWFDFEEDVNHYRAQGTMLIERNGVLNSADVGATAKVLLGRKLPKDYQETVSHAYPGTWGSIAFGAYNGGGYHAAEQNQDKVFASRVSIRPAGPWLPNLQLSHHFVYGKGNIAEEPAYMLNAFMASFEHEYFTLTGQYAFGEGNQKGDELDADGKALDDKGWSVFGEIKLPWIWSRIIGRYDWWKWGQAASQRLIAAVAFYFYKYNFIMIDYDRVMYDAPARPDDYEAKLTLQIYF